MKKILVPTDFTANADKALNFAVEIAKKAKAEIVLIHAAEIPGYTNDFSRMAEPDDIEAIFKNANGKLDVLEKSITGAEPVKVTTKSFAGTAIESILQSIIDFDIDLIVMGTMGSAGVKGKIYGSKTAGVIGKSDVPVMAIPLLSEWSAPKTLMIAINEFDQDNEKLEPAFKLASIFNSSVQVAVFTDTDDDAVEDYKENDHKIAGFRNKLREAFPGIQINAVHLAGYKFEERLTNWIEKHGIDILVMLTHKRGILESIFNRSKTKKMSYHTNIPLLAIPV